MPTGDIMRPEPDANLVIPYLYGVIPETATPCWWAGNLVDVIDENINFTLLRFNLFEEICYLLILTMIYPDAMTNAASGINRLDTGFYGELALTCSAPGNVDGCTLFSQGNSTALADTSRGTGYHTDFAF